MCTALASLSLPFAVHIGQDMIRWEWCLGGFAVAGLLMVWGAWGTKEEEISRIAVMTAAFFVASSIHVPVPGGPRTHLLLAGLVGVVLGRRSALAIPVGLLLQAILFQHGALSTLGANVCVMTPPALLSWLLFRGLCRIAWFRHGWFRAGLVLVSALAFVLSGVYAVTLLVTNWGSEVTAIDLIWANDVTFHPAVLAAALILGLLAAWLESRLGHTAEFPLGLLIGELSVFLTILLNALVLIFGGRANWHSLVLLTFVIHLPLAVLEGLILGFTVGFLARVKPEMLLGYRKSAPASGPIAAAAKQPPVCRPERAAVKSTSLLLGLLLVLATPSFVYAHRLNATWRLLPEQRIQVQSFFPGGYPPRDATIKVFRPDGSVLTEGDLDDKGLFIFRYEKAENLRIVIHAAIGTIDEHSANITIPADRLTLSGSASTQPATTEEDNVPFAITEESWVEMGKGILIGIGFLLALAAFLLSVRNARQLQALKRAMPQPPPDGDRSLTK
jgi:cobalt/nickel transport system permease protein